ncbi:MAG: trypsin-like peptidase domain-containing protein [bacterium]|nr:trypsin-like peptidase domain-containing protein [bacterium]
MIRFFLISYTIIICGIIVVFNLAFSADWKRISEYVKPSVVVVFIEIYGSISFYEPAINYKKLKQLDGEVRKVFNYGYLQYDKEELEKNVERFKLFRIFQEPHKYFVSSGKQKIVNFKLSSISNGVIINKNGYILTNDSVIFYSDKELKKHVINKCIIENLTKDLFYDIERTASLKLSLEDEDVLSSIIYNYIDSNVIDFEYYGDTFVGMGIFEKGETNVDSFFRKAAVLNVKDENYPNRDLALLKIEADNLPVSIISEHEPEHGSHTILLGYKVDSELLSGNVLEKFDIIKTVVYDAYVLSTVSSRGTQFVKIDKNIEDSSGYPVYNNAGQIIGVASNKLLQNLMGIKIKNYGILVSCQEIREVLRIMDIPNNQSEVDVNYIKAVDLYFDQEYREALRYFKKVHEIFPEHPYVKNYIAESQRFIKQDSGLKIGSQYFYFVLFLLFSVGVLFFLFLIVFVFIFFRRPKTVSVKQNYVGTENGVNDSTGFQKKYDTSDSVFYQQDYQKHKEGRGLTESELGNQELPPFIRPEKTEPLIRPEKPQNHDKK